MICQGKQATVRNAGPPNYPVSISNPLPSPLQPPADHVPKDHRRIFRQAMQIVGLPHLNEITTFSWSSKRR